MGRFTVIANDAFDALQVELISADTMPIEIKCKIDLK